MSRRPPGSLKPCHRCGKTVYPTEKVGPINDAVFHRNCFRCNVCSISLNVGTYCANPVDSGDRGVYCASHRPQLKNTQMDMEAVELRTAVSAQNFYNKTKDKDADIHRKSQVDAQAMSIQQAVSYTRRHNDELDAKAVVRSQVPSVQLESVGIQGPVRAQRMRRNKRATYSRHHFFPQLVAQRRREMREAQATLEKRHRAEEDSLFRRLMEERELRERRLAAEMKETWETRLEELLRRHAPENEKEELRKTIRCREEEQRSLIDSQIQEQAQERTAELVARQSREMLQLLAKKQQEMEQELEDLEEGGRQAGSGGGLAAQPSSPSPTATVSSLADSGPATVVGRQQQELTIPSSSSNLAAVVATAGEGKAGAAGSLQDQDARETASTSSAGEGEVRPSSLVEADDDAVPIIPERVPSPCPPSRRKAELYTDAKVFEKLDQRVIGIAAAEQLTFTDLADQLTSVCITELEKVRAIFRWITVKDLSALQIDKWSPDSPMGLLRGIQFGTETYHVLFMRLCSYAGIHAVEIKGYSKSVGYEPGMQFRNTQKFKNTWNAVFVDGEWRLIQCNWAARHLVFNRTAGGRGGGNAGAQASQQQQQQQKQDSAPSATENLRYHYDEHYFLTDPDQFIYEFYPFESKWQLLERPISLAEFEELPFVRSAFFQYGMQFPPGTKAVLEADEVGGANLQLSLSNPTLPLVCHYQLRCAETGAAHYKGTKLDRFVFFTVSSPGQLAFDIHVPNKRPYFLEIFAALVEPNNPATYGYQVRLKCVAKLKVVAAELQKRMTPLPQSSSSTGEWGPSKAWRHFLIKPLSHASAILNFDGSQSRELVLEFRVPDSILSENSAFSVLLHKNGVSTQALSRYARIQLDERRRQLTVRVKPPEAGAYALEIFLERKHSQPTHVCKYLVRCANINGEAAASISKALIVDESKVKSGPNSAALKRLPIVYASDIKYKTALEANSLALKFTFADDRLDFVAVLRRIPTALATSAASSGAEAGLEDHSDNCELRVVDQTATVVAHFVSPGRYHLHLFARLSQQQQQQQPFELCYSFKLDVTQPIPELVTV